MNWFNFQRTRDKARVAIFSEIGLWSQPAEDLISKLDGVRHVELFIDSTGGSCPDALKLYDFFAGIKTTVTITHAASSAVIVAMAGRKRLIHAGGNMMIHGPVDFASGDAPALRRAADWLDNIHQRFTGILCSRTGRPGATVKDWLSGKRDVWFTAQEARHANLVEEIIPPVRAKVPEQTATEDVAETPTESESLALDLLRALAPIKVRSREKFGRELAVWFANEVRAAV